MAVEIVDLLEVIDVEDGQRQRLAMPAAASAGSGRTQTGGAAAPSVYLWEAAVDFMPDNKPTSNSRGRS